MSILYIKLKLRSSSIEWCRVGCCYLKTNIDININKDKWLHHTDFGKVTYGIAQGSIIGTLIFILYANDLFKEIKYPNALLLYADDTLLWSNGKSMDECERLG